MDHENEILQEPMEEQAVGAASDDEDIMLPEGYKDGDDIFSDEPVEDDVSDLDTQPPGEAVSDPDTEEQPEPMPDPDTGEQTGEADELKFNDTLNGLSREVTMKRSELPGIYRKAQVADFAARRSYEQDSRAKALGYEGVDDLLSKIREDKIEAEKARLTAEDVHPELARQYAEQKYKGAAAMQQTRKDAAPVQQARNFSGELTELIAAYPALSGQKLPQEVMAAVFGGKSMIDAYKDYLHDQEAAELARLRKENEILKQNEAARAKAPVGSVTAGGAADTKPGDPFLAGFMADD